MPIEEILRNSAPAIGGLMVAAFALACARFGRPRRGRPQAAETPAAHPAE